MSWRRLLRLARCLSRLPRRRLRTGQMVRRRDGTRATSATPTSRPQPPTRCSCSAISKATSRSPGESPSSIVPRRRPTRCRSDLLENHSRASDDLIERVGLDQLVRATVDRASSAGTAAACRTAQKATTSSSPPNSSTWPTSSRSSRLGGTEAAISVARRASGHPIPPNTCRKVRRSCRRHLRRPRTRRGLGRPCLSIPQASRYPLSNAQLDLALRSHRPDFVDINIPLHDRALPRRGRARRGSGSPLRLDPADTTLLRRAALVHDPQARRAQHRLGQRGPLRRGARKGPNARYLSERMLAVSPALAQLGAVAGEHQSDSTAAATHADSPAPTSHRPAGSSQPPTATTPGSTRPHRPAQSPEQQPPSCARRRSRPDRLRRRPSHTHRGGTPEPQRRTWPAGLTTREVVIVRLLARGMTNSRSQPIVISPKPPAPTSTHLHQTRVNNRALAEPYSRNTKLITVSDA